MNTFLIIKIGYNELAIPAACINQPFAVALAQGRLVVSNYDTALKKTIAREKEEQEPIEMRFDQVFKAEQAFDPLPAAPSTDDDLPF